MTHKLISIASLAILFGCASAPVKPKEPYQPLKSLDKNLQQDFTKRLAVRLQTNRPFSEAELDTFQFISMSEWNQVPGDAPKAIDYPMLSTLSCFTQDSLAIANQKSPSLSSLTPLFTKLKQNPPLPLTTIFVLSNTCSTVSSPSRNLWLSDFASQIPAQAPKLSSGSILTLMRTLPNDSLLGKILSLADTSSIKSILQECKKSQKIAPCIEAVNSWPIASLCSHETVRNSDIAPDTFDVIIDARIRSKLSHQSVINPYKSMCILKEWRQDLDDSAFGLLDTNEYWAVLQNTKFPSSLRERALNIMLASGSLSDSLLLVLLHQEIVTSLAEKALEPKRSNKTWLLKHLPIVALAPFGTKATSVILSILNESHAGWKKAKGVSPNVLRMEKAVEEYQKRHNELAQNPVAQVELAKAGFVEGQVQRTWEMTDEEKAQALAAREHVIQVASAMIDDKTTSQYSELKAKQAQNVLKIRSVLDSEKDYGWRGVLEKGYGEDWFLIND